MRNEEFFEKLARHMDLGEREEVGEETKNGMKKCCCDCKTTRTPLWRAGPAGPKSLCNACGIRYRKTKRAMMAFKKKQRKEELDGCGGSCGNLGEDLRARLVALGKEVVVLQRQRSPMKRQFRNNMMKRKNKMGEVEQAACLLMALSCGSVFA